MNLEIVSASAGTGKTFTLARRLFEELEAGRVRPEGVVAITYTVKAARELESRIRRRLLEAGKADLAARVRDGYIGTIHAVCQRLLREFALETGLSPYLEPVPETERRVILERARAEVLRGREVRLNTLAERLEVEDWGEPLREVVDAARQNGLGPDDLRASARLSREGLTRLLGSPALDEATYLSGVRAALADLIPGLENDTGSKAGRDRLADAQRILGALVAGRRPTWKAQVKLAGDVSAKKLAQVASPFREWVARHLECTAFHEDLLTFQAELFELAAETLDAFVREKNAARVVDFGDMLAHAHRLLGLPAVQAVLRDRLELVLVDEVQDTSPLQLAVVTALGSLARRSVWVGDRKQAIFGFQGSDPELMTAALDAVLGGQPPEILGTSYRSREQLVEFTSELFAGAFAAQGLPREQVVLAAEKVEPKKLQQQPPFACWSYEGGRAKPGEPARSEAHAVAEAVEGLLERDPALLVRDRVVGGEDKLRPVTKRDIAVLAYRNGRCSEIAAALRERGIPARVATAGLSATPEGRLARAAVALLADPRDGVAALEVSWLAGQAAADPDAWLSGLLETTRGWRAARAEAEARGELGPERPLPFADEPRVAALRAASLQATGLSPGEAFDLALRAGRLGEVVRAWPDPGQALANLEALRAAARGYEDLCTSRRVAATVLGLVAHLGALSEDEDADRQATPTADDAVTVSTWHRSKGLEWPVVILSELDHDRARGAFDVATVAAPVFRFERPLADRWVRYWPWPYGKLSKDLALADLGAASPEGKEATARDQRERLRLLYVIFTRARDLLGFVVQQGKEGPKVAALEPLRDEQGAPRAGLPFEAGTGLGEVTLGKRRWPCPVEELSACAPEEPAAPRGALPWYAAAAAAPQPRPREVVNPSAEPLAVAARVVSVARLGDRGALAGPSDMRAVGDAIHAFLAADEGGAPDRRRAMAQRLLAGFDVAGSLAPETLLSAADALRGWAEQRFPGATWHREWPLRARLPGDPPRLLVGEADLVLETPAGFAIVDHKSFPGNAEERDRRLVEEYAPQLAWYAHVLTQALGKPLLGAFVHLPLRGEIAEVALGPGP